MTEMEKRLARRIHHQRQRLAFYEKMEWSWSRTWRRSALRWRKENAELRTALNDAINSPKGVVPASAEKFWDSQAGQVSRRFLHERCTEALGDT